MFLFEARPRPRHFFWTLSAHSYMSTLGTFPAVILPSFRRDLHKLLVMAFTRTQIGIAVGAGVLLVAVFLGYVWWLSDQGPVLARSEEHDPLTGCPSASR